MPAPTAQNLLCQIRSAASLTSRRSATSVASSSKRKPSSSPAPSANVDVQKKLPSSSNKKPSSSSSSLSAASAAVATQEKISSSSLKKLAAFFPASAGASANHNRPSSDSVSAEDADLKKYVSSIRFPSSSANVSESVKCILKNFKAPPSWTAATPPKSSLCHIVSDSLNSGGGNDDVEKSAKEMHINASSILYDEMDLDWDDECKNVRHLGNSLDMPWLSGLSNSDISVPRNEVSRVKKNSWVYKTLEVNRFGRLAQMCAQKLGPDTTLSVFLKLGKETGLKEYNALIKICIDKARDTTDEDVALDQIYKAYQILKSMREKGFKIEEGTYGQFLMYLIDNGMVDEFFFFCELIKEGNPDSLPRIAYYEMFLWLNVNNEEKVQELCHSAMANTAEEKSKFRENLLLALSGSDHRKEFLMLLETLQIAKVSSVAFLNCIFRSLGKFSMETMVEKFVEALKNSDIGAENISNFICEYAISIPNLAVEDINEKSHMLHNKLEVLPTAAQYEKLIRNCCESLKVYEALDVVDKALESGVALSVNTFLVILAACEQSCEYNLVHQIYQRISCSCSLKPNNEIFRMMILLCVRMKDYEGAYGLIRDLLKMNRKPTAGMYNIILAGYLREKNILCAMKVLKQMEEADVKPDAMTFSYLISSSHNEKGLMKYYQDMINSGVKPTKQVFMAIINAYASCGLFEKAEEVMMDHKRIPVEELPVMKSVYIGALASNGQISAALKLYEEVKEDKCDVDPKVIKYLIEHFNSEEELNKLFQLLEEIKDSPYWTGACFCVISHCIQEESLSSIIDLLKQLEDKFRNEVPVEVLFDEVFCLYAEKEATSMQFGLDLLQAIKKEFGVCPSRKSLDFLLSACVNAKDSKASFVIWKEYETAGLPYNVLSFLRMYQALLASGDNKSAAQILKKILKDDFHVRCVVQACQETYTRAAARKKLENKKKRTISSTLRLLDALRAKN